MHKLHALWNGTPDGLKRVLHTFWQAAGGTLAANLLLIHSTQDVKATVAVAIAAGLAAVKSLVLSRA